MAKQTHDEIHAETFRRINTLESKMDETNGYLRGVVESNEKLITLLEKRDTTLNRVVWALIVLLFFALGVIAFGAIGERGMHSVRQNLPMPDLPTSHTAIPAHNDFDKWQWCHAINNNRNKRRTTT